MSKPSNLDTTGTGPRSDGDTARRDIRAHRTEYWDWVEHHADPAIRDVLLILNDHWQKINAEYFDGVMHPPYITLTEPSAPQIYGQCCPLSSWGSRLEIRIRPSLLEGTHPHLKAGDDHRPGRIAFVKDILLHESVHQYVMEHRPDVDEHSYHGHGPVFASNANRIGAQLGLDSVVVRHRGPGDRRPVAPQWPHNVRDPSHYGGAYDNRSGTTGRDTGPVLWRPSMVDPISEDDTATLELDAASGDRTLTLRFNVDDLADLADLINTSLWGDGEED